MTNTEVYIKYYEDVIKTFEYLLKTLHQKYDNGVISLNYLQYRETDYLTQIDITKQRIEYLKTYGLTK